MRHSISILLACLSLVSMAACSENAMSSGTPHIRFSYQIGSWRAKQIRIVRVVDNAIGMDSVPNLVDMDGCMVRDQSNDVRGQLLGHECSVTHNGQPFFVDVQTEVHVETEASGSIFPNICNPDGTLDETLGTLQAFHEDGRPYTLRRVNFGGNRGCHFLVTP